MWHSNIRTFEHSIVILALCVAGCFNEPEPAYRSVPAESQVYLNGKGLKTLTVETLVKDGEIAVDGKMVKLSTRVTTLDAATLTYLNLDRNALTDVSALGGFTALKWLRLNENQLTGLPDLNGLVGLRRIYLRGNRLTDVPETLKDLPAITDIELSENQIATIPDWLAKKPGLKNLSFNRTAITKLPDDLTAWESLQSLQLGDLKLSPEEMARVRAALPHVRIVF